MNYLDKARWVVKINDSKTKRVLIEYFALKNKLVFSGQLKVGDFQITFSKIKILLNDTKFIRKDELNNSIFEEIKINIDDIDIDDTILKVYLELEEKIEIHSRFSERMTEYANIKISDEDINI